MEAICRIRHKESAELYWDEEAETLARGELNALQSKRLQRVLGEAVKSPWYKDKLDEPFSRFDCNSLKTLSLTTKDDLRQNFPYGFLTVPKEDIVRLHSSSGTTGNPTVVFHTRDDIEQWADLVARCMYMAGVRRSDVFQNIMGYGLFTGGLGFHYGAEKIGALTIPSGPGNSHRQVWFMRTFETSVLHILPSYALRLHASFLDEGLDPARDSSLKILFLGAEPHSEQLRAQIEQMYGVKAFNSYGLSEMCGPGVAFECEYRNGMHVWEDHYIAEIIDPETGVPVPEGEEGELVLTTLRRTAMPLIRYRTRDLTRFVPGDCPCGRTHRRIERIKGRSDDMLIINGVNIFPMQIERTVMGVPGTGKNYMIEIKKEQHLDRVHVIVEVDDRTFQGTLSGLEELQKELTDSLRDELGVNPKVRLVEAGSLPAFEGKAQRVKDLRGQS